MAEHKIQDDIQLGLQAQKVITHETVRLSVQINAQVDPSQSESDFRAEIQNTLRGFVDAEWKIQSVNRQKCGKYETVYVSAMARVSERENHHLSERADAVSRIGFELTNPNVDYTLSFDDIQKINRELRLTLMNAALAECSAMNEAFKKAGYRQNVFRVSSSGFSQGQNQQVTNNNAQYATYALANIAATSTASPTAGGAAPPGMMDAGDGAEDAPADLNVSTRFWMTGSFTLRSVVNG